MVTKDKCCTIVPYFEIPTDKLELFMSYCQRLVAKTQSEPKCLYYGFTFHENRGHCREGYADAEGVLAHLENVGALLEEALSFSELTQLEIHGPAEEIDKLREPLAKLNPAFFILECGFRR